MKYTLRQTKKFEKDVKRCARRAFPMNELKKVFKLLEESGKLPAQYRPHKLSGNYDGCWECHIKADWLLIWQEYEDKLILLLTGTGSHADLFG